LVFSAKIAIKPKAKSGKRKEIKKIMNALLANRDQRFFMFLFYLMLSIDKGSNVIYNEGYDANTLILVRV